MMILIDDYSGINKKSQKIKRRKENYRIFSGKPFSQDYFFSNNLENANFPELTF